MKRTSMPKRKSSMRRYSRTLWLRPDDPIPDSTPRRYVTREGYVVLRWRVAPYECVQEYEHRVVMGRPTGRVVHHINRDRADNRPENLQVLTAEEHLEEHGRADAAAMKADYEAGMTLKQVAAKHDVHHTNVLRRIRAVGATLRPAKSPTRPFDVEEAVAMYADGVGIDRIARKYRVSAARILREVDAAGVPRKPAGVPKGSASRQERNARKLVYARSEGACEICGELASEWHHRKNRSQGGTWTASNGLHLCSRCHRYVTEHPSVSYACGWAVRRAWKPAEMPVLTHRHGWVLLTNGGDWTDAPKETA